ncbi:type II secretion system protein [Candidatus Peregrinibacteria bacterium]|jgi:prepilin-type N-terminal cleavage/methylation domain-containing protein|nr:type II secretion system protein [Candidatus Peregrinibacteria bacterium]
MRDMNKKKAFTLIELLVVLTIFGVIILTALYTLGRSMQQVRLQMTVEQAMSDLRFDQNLVKSGQVVEDGVRCLGGSFSVEDSFYQRVAALYSEGCGEFVGSNESSYSTGVELTEITSDDGTVYDSVNVIFEPPSGRVVFEDGVENPIVASSLNFNFSYTLDDEYSHVRVMTVSRSGQITVN